MRQAWLAVVVSLGLLVSAWAGQPFAKALADPVSPQAAAAEPEDTIRPGTVTGKLTVKDQTAELKYAYVKQGPSLREGTAFVVVLSDAPIAEATLRQEEGLEAPAAEGKLHAVEVTFSPELQPRWGRAYHDAFSNPPVSAYPSLHFVPSSYDGATLAGRVYAEKNSSDEVPWEFTATLSIVLDPGGQAAAAPAASAPGLGTTTGTLTVGGKTAQLRYAYAHAKEEDKLVVVLSDVPLEESSWRGEQELAEQASAGKVHVIWANFDDVLKPNSAATYYDNSAGSAPYEFVPTLYDGKTLAGKLYASGSEWEYTATFSVPIHPKPEPPAADPADTIHPGTVVGKLTVKEQTVELQYAYVKQGPSLEEGAAFVIVVSDVPVEESRLREADGLATLAFEGKLHAVEVTFSPELKPMSGRAYHDAFSGGSGSAYGQGFVPSLYDGTTLAGRVYVEKDSSDEEPWEYTATFSIALDPGGKAAPAPAAATAPGSGTVAGSLTVAGKAAQLKYVYAHVKEDSHEKGKEKLVVLLSDVPLEESAWRWEAGLFSSAREGKLHAIWAEFDDVVKPNFAQIYHNGFKSGSASMNGMHRFVLSRYDGKTFAGKLYVEPDDFFDITWEYSATFSAPISPKAEAPPKAAAIPPADLPEPEVDWNALSEQQKGPAKLAVEIIQAFRQKDKATLKKSMTAEEAAKLDEPLAEMILELASAAFSVPIKVTQVVMEGDDKAEVHFQIEGRPDPGKVKAVLVNGEWRGTN